MNRRRRQAPSSRESVFTTAIAGMLVCTGSMAQATPECTHPDGPDGPLSFGLMGDINESGTRNVADALCATMAALVSLGTTAGEPQWPSCVQVDPLLLDLNCDGEVNLADAQLVVWLATTNALPEAIASGASGCPDVCEAGSLPVKGGSAENPARSGRDAFESGLTEGDSAWIEIDGVPYLMEYDPSDRFDTGQHGWVHYSNDFFGQHHATIPWEVFGSPINIRGAWNTISSFTLTHDTLAAGQMRLGRNEVHTSGVLSLNTIRVALPALTAARYELTDAVAGGQDAPDFGTTWQNGQPYEQIVNNTPYQDNGTGYFAVVWSGSPAGSWSTDLLILDGGQPPGTGVNYLGAYTFTGTVHSFPQEVGSDAQVPYAIFGTTDAWREYVFLNEWGIWLH